MAWAVWSGAITFGLVTIPVSLYSATEDHTIHFHQYARGTSDRVRIQRVNERTGEEVPSEDVVKGREVNGEIVVVENDEPAAIAPGRSQTIDVVEFVDLAEIDPVYFDRAYWVAPADDRATHAYGLLRRALEQSGRAGIAAFVMRGREHLTALRADGGVLALQTLRFADEIRDPVEQADTLPVAEDHRRQEIDMALSLIGSMTNTWRPEEYRDTYTERVEQLVAEKKEGREVVPAAAPGEATEVGDLLDALRRSVEAAGGSAPSGSARSTGSAASTASAEGGELDEGHDERGGGDDEDLASLSKSELERRARALDVRGRSSMNRDELARAVADARAGRSDAS